MTNKIAVRRLIFAGMLGLIWLGFGLRIYAIGDNSLWYDELLQVDIAQGPLAHILPQMERHAAMPLDYVILHFWIKLGRQEFWVRWPALVFGMLAIPLIYRVGHTFFNQRTGLLAAILLTWASLAVQYSREVRPYALLLVLTLLAFFGLWQVYQTQQWRYWLVAIGGIVGATFTHYFALFLLLPLGLLVAGQQVRHWRQSSYWGHTALFGLGLFLVLTTLVLTGRFKAVYNVSFGAAQVVTAPNQLASSAAEKPNRGSGPPLERTFFVDSVLSPLATGQPAFLLLYMAFFLVGLGPLLVYRAPQRGAIVLLLGWLLLPISLIYLFLLYRGTFYAVRYVLYTLPAFLILVAYGLDLTGQKVETGLRKFGFTHFGSAGKFLPLGPSLVVAGLLLPLLWAKTGELQTTLTAEAREDWRAVGELLQHYAAPEDVVIAVRAEPTMNWYYPSATAHFGKYDQTPRIWQVLNQGPRRWFVLSSYSAKRDKALRDWLAGNEAVMIGIDRRVVLFVQQQGVSASQLLAEIEHFSLPAKPITYLTLANQFEQHGQIETSRRFYQHALQLAGPDLKGPIEAEMIKRDIDLTSAFDGS